MQHPLLTAASTRPIVKNIPLEATHLPPAMHVIRMTTLLLADLRPPHGIIAITLRLQFAGVRWTIIECVDLLPRPRAMSLGLATTALTTQLHTLAATPLRRLETTIDMTDEPLHRMTGMGVTHLPQLSGQGHLLEGALHHAGKNLRDLHGLYHFVGIVISADRLCSENILLRLSTVAR
jgi:hypothetical protein